MGDEGNNINVEGRVIGESSKITLTVKTALWILAIFASILTYGYFDLKSDVRDYKDSTNKVIVDKFEKERDKDEQTMKDVEDIKGNVQLLLDRTQGIRGTVQTQPTTPTINTNTPTTIPQRR